MRLHLLCVAMCALSLTLAQNLERETCDQDRMMVDVNVADADVLIGGVFNMRVPGPNGQCGEIMQENMLTFEAARWAINRINSNNFIPGIKLGMKAYDTCRSPYRALSAAYNFFPEFSANTMYCNQTNKLNLGLLGAQTSWTSKPVAETTGKFPRSMISMAASSSALSDKSKYPYFMRTAPSAAEQIKGILRLLNQFQWERVVLVYSENDYGMDAMKELVRVARGNGVCIVDTISVPNQGDIAIYEEKLKDIGKYGVVGAIYYGDHFSSVKVLSAVNNIPSAAQLQWILTRVNVKAQFLSPRQRGTIYVQPNTPFVSEFFDYFTNNLDENNPPAENPWYQDWFMTVFQCRLSGINYAPFNVYSSCTSKTAEQKLNAVNSYYFMLITTIKAIYAYAHALKDAQSATCGSGFCLGLQQITPETFHNYLMNVNFDMGSVINSLSGETVSFDGNGDMVVSSTQPSSFRLWNYNNQPTGSYSYKDVGMFTLDSLSVSANIFMYNDDRSAVLPAVPKSLCPASGCNNCVVPRLEVNFNYLPGDVVIAGLFDIHAQGPEVLTCGALKANHAMNAAAFMYAINTVKQRFPGILQGVNLGSLVIDLCDNADNGRLLVNKILSGRDIVYDSKGLVVDPNPIKNFVGELDSTEAISMASNLGHVYNMPYIESSATAIDLSDRMMYPTFSRTVPSDAQQVHALILLLKRMGWTYIQMIYTDDAYGRGSYEMIKSYGAAEYICIAAAHKYTDADGTVTKLNNNPSARAVVAILDSDQYRDVLQALKQQNLSDTYVLLASETWGNSLSIVQGLESVAEGTFTMSLSSPSLLSFRNWLISLNERDEDTVEEMPYFVEWYQYAFQCYISAENKGTYTQQCQPGRPITQATFYTESPYTAYMISATYTAAMALHRALSETCGDNYNGICWQFRSDTTVKAKMLEYIRDAEFNLDGVNYKIENGEGIVNYDILYFTNGAYTKVATYRTEDRDLSFQNLPSMPSFSSQCTGFCSECVYLLQSMPYTVLPSNELKVGLSFAITNPNPSDPFLCSNFRLTNGMQSAVAVAYAIEKVNNGQAPVSLNDVQLGALFFDHCNSPSRAYGLPAALYSGLLEARSQPEMVPNLNTIRTWITDNTLVTEQMKAFFNDLNLPVISTMTTSNKFFNEEEYPTFLRTIQGDSTISTALAVLVKSLGLQYVTLVYSDSTFGNGGVESFSMIAMQEGVCIVNKYKMGNNATNLLEMLVKQPTHVVITYLDHAHMDAFLTARGNVQNGENLVIVSPEPYYLLFSQRGMAARNFISLRMTSNDLSGFTDWLSQQGRTEEYFRDHPELKGYYMELFKCNLPGEYMYAQDCQVLNSVTSSPNFFVDNYVLPTINAVYTFVAAAHETLKTQCGENYDMVCTKFYSDPNTNTLLRENMLKVGYEDDSGEQFRFIGKEGNTGREFIMFDGQQTTKIAEFAGASIRFTQNNLQNMFENTLSSCEFPCSECVNNNMNFTYIPGDILLGGIFDVHESDLRPFSCGGVNTLRGFQLLEAFHFAINKVNDKSGMFANILKDVKLGGVGLDACESGVRGGYIVSNIHSGLTTLQRNGDVIDPDNIDAYIGTYSSDRSIYLARLMKTLKIPQIAYGSTSTSLLDQDRYPYFLRTIPADDKQAMAMIRFLQKYEIKYVQVIHTSDNYGEKAAEVFNELALEEGICVAQTVAFAPKSVVTDESANDMVLALLTKPIANTVITFADTDFINKLLEAIERNAEAHNKFKFIGSDTWANNVESTDGFAEFAEGSVTLDLESVDIAAFDQYLSEKTPANYPENPWFPEYYEEIMNCYLTIPDKRYPRRCLPNPEQVVASPRYKQDTAIIHVINAVYAAAIGLDSALKSQCGEDYSTVCEAFKNYDGRRDLVLEHIKKAQFKDMSGIDFQFSPRGDGTRGYIFYSFQTSNRLGYIYSPIGKYSNDYLNLNENYQPDWDGSCGRDGACTECPTVRNPLTRYMLSASGFPSPDDAILIMTTNIHRQGIDSYLCGDMNMGDMMNALSVIFTLTSTSLIPRNFNLRPLILDNCNNQLRIDQDLYNLFTTGKLCNADFDMGNLNFMAENVVGVQTSSSRFVVAANRVTAPLKIQLLSGSASSTELSEQWRYPYFARTVPPDDQQMLVIAKILRANGWSYVGVVYTKDSYGTSGMRSLTRIVNEGQYSCVGFAEGIDIGATTENIRPVIRRLANQDGIGVVVLIVENPRRVLEAIIAEGVSSRFVVIGTDSWANFRVTTEGIAQQFRGALTVGFRTAFYSDYIAWLQEITKDDRKGIPDDWFEEFYQTIHSCHDKSFKTVMSDKFPTECNANLLISEETLKKYAPGIQSMAATFAIGNGLNDFSNNYGCANMNFKDCMSSVDNARDTLFGYTLDQTWNIPRGSIEPQDAFNMVIGDKRYWNVGYTIYNLHGNNTYAEVGKQTETDFIFNRESYNSYRGAPVVSKCPEDKICDCNIAEDGTPIPQVQEKYMLDHEPRNYFVYDEDTDERTYTWPIWAIAVAVLSCIGLLVGLLLFFYFLIFYPVRGGTTALGFLAMIGLFGIYGVNFAFFLPAAVATCAARQFCMGVVYSIVFAALFVKSVDNWRFKDSGYSTQKYIGLANPCSLLMIAFGIILVQCIIPIEWLILRNPTASLMDDSTNKHDWMWCDPHDFYDISLVLSMAFVIFLVVMTAIFSALAWDSEANWYESRWIFVSSVCTAGCFLVWMVVSTNAGPPYRDPAVAIGNFVNATAILIFIPLRKLVLLVQVNSDEEKTKSIPMDDANTELYSTVYTNQVFQPDVFHADSKADSDGGY